jgi:hypothetical protein
MKEYLQSISFDNCLYIVLKYHQYSFFIYDKKLNRNPQTTNQKPLFPNVHERQFGNANSRKELSHARKERNHVPK